MQDTHPKHTEDLLSEMHVRRVCFVPLLFVLPILGACASVDADHPRYHPITGGASHLLPIGTFMMPTKVKVDDVPIVMAVNGSLVLLSLLVSAGSAPSVGDGYQDDQIDENTYFVTYSNYIGVSRSRGQQIDRRGDKWIKGAQEYVLYRAAELAKSKGAQYFAVLYQDDWNVLSTWSTPNDVQPGAGLLIRLLNSSLSESQSDNRLVYDADLLLQTLAENNRGLAEYAKKPLPDELGKKNRSDFRRWRESVDRERVKLIPELGASTRSRITQDLMGNFQIMTWEDRFGPISPIQFLWQCVTLARHEGWRTFRLENWSVEEQETDGALWFITAATIIPNYQMTSQSIEPVFAVEEMFVNAKTTP